MQYFFHLLPPIPLLLLSILILVWIVPLLIARIVAYFRPEGGKPADLTNDPKKISLARRSFYQALFFSVIWSLLFLVVNRSYSELHRGELLLFVALSLLATTVRYRHWRRLEANLGIENHSRHGK